MFLTIDGNNIVKGPCPIRLDNSQIEVQSQWPESSPGQPYRKSECYWTGSMVAVKTTAMQVAEYKTKKFKELNDKIISKLMYVKKLKKFDNTRDLFIDEYKKTQASKDEIDVSIALIETDLFEA